jgi:RimJ/RimL family protein N-acetyltransferase
MKTVLETERLRLRFFTLNDTDFIVRLLNTSGWIQYIGDRNVKTKEQAETYLRNGAFKSYEVNGFGLSMVEIKKGNIPIGMSGILRRDELENPDIGFAFLPEYMGKGYAQEISQAIMKYAKEVLKLEKILAITLPTNQPSIKLLEKIGLSFQKHFSFPGTNEELMLFSN